MNYKNIPNTQLKDWTGQKRGMLTVIKLIKITDDKKRKSVWLCKCDCGNFCEQTNEVLYKNQMHSCGCYNKERLDEMSANNITHGMTGKRIYRCWYAMKSRCYREKDIHYNAYGKRGIKVCDEWLNNSKAFIDWALQNGYSDTLTLDRIDVNGNYEPSNCRWITMEEQYKNKQSNSLPKFEGVK